MQLPYDLMEKILNENYKSIKATMNSFKTKFFDMSDTANIPKIINEIELLPENTLIVFCRFAVSKVGENKSNFVVVLDGGGKNTLIVSFLRKQITTTPITDLVGIDMDGIEDLTDAHLVYFVCEKNAQLLSNNTLGLTGVDIYACGTIPHDPIDIFLARDNSGRVCIIDSVCFEMYEDDIKSNYRNKEIESLASGYARSNDLTGKKPSSNIKLSTNEDNESPASGCISFIIVVIIIIFLFRSCS